MALGPFSASSDGAGTNLPARAAWITHTAAFRGTLSAGWSRSFFLARARWVKTRMRMKPEGPEKNG